MQKILLAIDGITPDKKALYYAVELCKRIQAELAVLEIISYRNYFRYIKSWGDRVNQARKYVENSMVAVTFAEAGNHEMAKALQEEAQKKFSQLLPESERDAVHCHLSMKSGSPDKEIVRYVNDHRDIVLTIYDTLEHETAEKAGERKTKPVSRRIRQQLLTPLVVVKGLRG